jgi:hypothetical protein
VGGPAGRPDVFPEQLPARIRVFGPGVLQDRGRGPRHWSVAIDGAGLLAAAPKPVRTHFSPSA